MLTSQHTLGDLCLLIAVLFGTLILKAWIISQLWLWYIVPAFGLPALRTIYAFGLALILNFTLPYRSDRVVTRDYIVSGIGFCVFTLLVGWVGTWFI